MLYSDPQPEGYTTSYVVILMLAKTGGFGSEVKLLFPLIFELKLRRFRFGIICQKWIFQLWLKLFA